MLIFMFVYVCVYLTGHSLQAVDSGPNADFHVCICVYIYLTGHSLEAVDSFQVLVCDERQSSQFRVQLQERHTCMYMSVCFVLEKKHDYLHVYMYTWHLSLPFKSSSVTNASRLKSGSHCYMHVYEWVF